MAKSRSAGYSAWDLLKTTQNVSQVLQNIDTDISNFVSAVQSMNLIWYGGKNANAMYTRLSKAHDTMEKSKATMVNLNTTLQKSATNALNNLNKS